MYETLQFWWAIDRAEVSDITVALRISVTALIVLVMWPVVFDWPTTIANATNPVVRRVGVWRGAWISLAAGQLLVSSAHIIALQHNSSMLSTVASLGGLLVGLLLLNIGCLLAYAAMEMNKGSCYWRVWLPVALVAIIGFVVLGTGDG